MKQPELTAKRLRELLSYDASTDTWRWKVQRGYQKYPGDLAGSKQRTIRMNPCTFFIPRLVRLYALPDNATYAQTKEPRNDHLRGKRALTAKRLRELLTYDGNVFRWRHARKGIFANQIAAPNNPDIIIDWSMYRKPLLAKLYEMPDETPFTVMLGAYRSRPRGQYAPKQRRPRRNTQLQFDFQIVVEQPPEKPRDTDGL